MPAANRDRSGARRPTPRRFHAPGSGWVAHGPLQSPV